VILKAVQHVEISRVLATPFVRQMARGMKIDIQQVSERVLSDE
jgi:hypothetical protein